jgi:hypothetical protein
MKRFLLTLAATAMLFSNTMAEGTVTVFSNGNEVADKGVIVDGRTLVPVRGVFEYMGYDVQWDAETKTATLTNSDKDVEIVLTNGNEYFTVNGKNITTDVPQQIIDGRFMLPLRALGDAVNANVNWDGENKVAEINEVVADNSKDNFDDGDVEIEEDYSDILKAFSVEVIDDKDVDNDNVNTIQID